MGGLASTRRFLLELLSFLHRYVPVGITHPEAGPPRINWRPPQFVGRCELETLMASDNVDDWIELSVRAGLPPPADGFSFNPKHKSNSYATQQPAGQAAPASTEVQG